MNTKKNLYTLILECKNNTYVYQVLAKQEIEAQIIWVSEVDLIKIGVSNPIKVKKELAEDANNEDFYPALLNGLQSVWCSSVSSLGNDLAIANIVNTIGTKNNHNYSSVIDDSMLFHYSKPKILYTVQLGYKGGTYVSQVFAYNQIDAKIAWIKQLDFNVISGAPKNIEETKNNILLQQKESDFIPQELKDINSVWSTNVQLGDEIGRVTIVATQTNIVNLSIEKDKENRNQLCKE